MIRNAVPARSPIGSGENIGALLPPRFDERHARDHGKARAPSRTLSLRRPFHSPIEQVQMAALALVALTDGLRWAFHASIATASDANAQNTGYS